MERRSLSAEMADVRIVEARMGADPPAPIIVGYAAVWYNAADSGTQYQLFPDLVERLIPGCFDRALREDDVRALYNHNPDHLLARSKKGTMELSQDDRGLLYRIKYDPADPDHQRVASKIKRGDLTGSSFSFVARGAKYIRPKDGSPNIREIHDAQLFDVGPVTFPAYEATSAAMRSAGTKEVQEEYERWKAAELRTQHTLYEVEARCREIAHE